MTDDPRSAPPRSFAEVKERLAAGGGAGSLRFDARRADDAEVGRRAAERSRRDKEALPGTTATSTAPATAERADAVPTGPVRSFAELRRRHAAGLR